ncbi:MAG: hypothetical protein QXO69_01740 [archaeon]
MKAFVASIALIACFALLMRIISVSYDATGSMKSVKNTIILGQRLSERQYWMQHSFENAVKSAKPFLSSEFSDADNSVILCMKIKEIAGYSVSSGCIDENYGIDELRTSEIKLKDSVRDLVSDGYISFYDEVVPCVKFIRYDKETGNVIVGLNTKLDYENNIINCDSGFLLESNVSNHKVKTIIPMEAVL